MLVDFAKAIKANESFTRLMLEAQECERLHHDAGIPLPWMLQALLGQPSDKAAKNPASSPIRPLPTAIPLRRNNMPTGVSPDAISLRIADCGPATVARALLRRDGPRRVTDLAEQVTSITGNATTTSFWGTTQRMKLDGQVAEHEGVLRLLDPEMGGVIDGEFLWTSPKPLTPQEVATYRREMLLQLLSEHGTLRTVQFVSAFRTDEWAFLNANKDAIKGDTKALRQQGKVKPGKDGVGWELSPEEAGARGK